MQQKIARPAALARIASISAVGGSGEALAASGCPTPEIPESVSTDNARPVAMPYELAEIRRLTRELADALEVYQNITGERWKAHVEASSATGFAIGLENLGSLEGGPGHGIEVLIPAKHPQGAKS